jgi:hypothetical protein
VVLGSHESSVRSSSVDLNVLNDESLKVRAHVVCPVGFKIPCVQGTREIVIEDTFYETFISNVWVSRRTVEGEVSWRLVKTADIGKGAFYVFKNISEKDEITRWIKKKSQFPDTVLEDMPVLASFRFRRLTFAHAQLDQLIDEKGISRGPVIVSFVFSCNNPHLAKILEGDSTFCSKVRMYRERFREMDLAEKFKESLSPTEFDLLDKQRRELDSDWQGVHEWTYKLSPEKYTWKLKRILDGY